MKELDLTIKTMTLKEITDLLDVRHNDAMKIVSKMAQSPEFGELRLFRSSYKNNIGAKLPLDTYQLDKRQSIAVSAQLNTALLMRVIDRWIELEAKEQQKIQSEKVRSELRLEYNPMNVALTEHRQEQGKETKHFHFSNEADLLNRIALGMTSAKFKVHHDIDDKDAIRDYLTLEQKNALLSLQRANTAYIEEGVSFEERKERLTKLFNNKYSKRLIEELYLINE